MTTFLFKPACLALVLFLGVASEVHAYNLGKVTSGPPEASFMSERELYVIERCIVMLDLPSQPSVYRTPDRPDESLIHFGQTTPMAIKLAQSSGRVEIAIYNGSKYANRIRECAGS